MELQYIELGLLRQKLSPKKHCPDFTTWSHFKIELWTHKKKSDTDEINELRESINEKRNHVRSVILGSARIIAEISATVIKATDPSSEQVFEIPEKVRRSREYAVLQDLSSNPLFIQRLSQQSAESKQQLIGSVTMVQIDNSKMRKKPLKRKRSPRRSTQDTLTTKISPSSSSSATPVSSCISVSTQTIFNAGSFCTSSTQTTLDTNTFCYSCSTQSPAFYSAVSIDTPPTENGPAISAIIANSL
jgi:hypothetical protein